LINTPEFNDLEGYFWQYGVFYCVSAIFFSFILVQRPLMCMLCHDPFLENMCNSGEVKQQRIKWQTSLCNIHALRLDMTHMPRLDNKCVSKCRAAQMDHLSHHLWT